MSFNIRDNGGFIPNETYVRDCYYYLFITYRGKKNEKKLLSSKFFDQQQINDRITFDPA